MERIEQTSKKFILGFGKDENKEPESDQREHNSTSLKNI